MRPVGKKSARAPIRSALARDARPWYRRGVREVILAAPDPGFEHRMSVRFQDVDAAGILFFARFFDYFHDGYFAFMAHRGVDFAAALTARTWAAPLKHAEADFLAPARFGDVVSAQVVGQRIDGSKVTLFHRLRREDRVLAVARTDHVYVDVETFRRVPLPDVVHAALSTLPEL